MSDGMWDSIAEKMMKSVLREGVLTAFNDRVRINAELNEKDGCYGAGLILMCEEDSCPDRNEHDGCCMVKSAFIFDTEREALEYAMDMKRHRRKELLDSLQ